MLESCGSESRLAKKGRRAWWPGKGSAGFVMAIATVVAFWSAQMQAQPWMNTALAPEDRANLLLAQMSLDEKIAMVHGVNGQYVGNTTNNSRLGIPALHLQDGPAGVADGVQGVTALPAPICLAASFDRDLARQYGLVIGTEARAKGVHVSLGPMINMVRVPQGGRAFETFGEDPYLTSVIAAQHIRGIQSQGLIANAKHFICNDQEYTRGNQNSIVDERTLQEIYGPPFLASIGGGVGSICAAYNMINGNWCPETPLLTSLVKGKWGFKGFVECDWGGNFNMANAALNGLDMEMPHGDRFGDPLKSAVLGGTVPMSQLDQMVRRILAAMFRFRIFDNPTTGTWGAYVITPDHTQLARTVAEQGIVLLKNSGPLLPLNPAAIRSIAVSGSAAAIDPIWTGSGSALVYPTYYDTPLNEISNRAGAGITITYNQGDGGHANEAAQLAALADIAIVCVGQQTGEGGDRANLTLPDDQNALVSAVAAANPRTIVVLYEGAGTVLPWIAQVPAALSAWYPGEQGSAALARILFGDVNPSGKLPVTFPAATNQVPANTAWQYPGTNLQVTYSEGLLVGYRWYDAQNVTPLFPFGHGLSYTAFNYRNLAISPVTPGGRATVELDVQNSGGIAGVETVQLYLGFPAAAGEPPRQLKGFQKVSLQPGATSHVAFNLNWEDLAHYDVNSHAWLVSQGTFAIMIGSSERDIRLTGSLAVPPSVPSSGRANLVLFQPATASGFVSGHAANAAVDGDPATTWSTANATSSLVVDLGAVKQMNRIRLFWATNYARGYQVQASSDSNAWSTLFSTSSGAGGAEELLVNGSGRYVLLSATQSGTGAGYSLQELEVFAPDAASSQTNIMPTMWVDDSAPSLTLGADGGDSWLWINSNPSPFAGNLAHQSALAAGEHQHYFYNATTPLSINANDTLIAYIYLDAANPPSEVMLQWNAGSWDWEHRAYWGADQINFGLNNTPSKRYLGPLPGAGQWVRLSVPASQVGLEGTTLYGMAFTLFNGQATWDYSGKLGANPPPPDTNAPTVGITSPANNAVLSGNVTITANANDDVAVSTVQFRVDGVNLGTPDASSPYSIGWDTSSASNGTHQLTASATDTSGNVGNSSVVTVTVSNATTSTADFVWVEDSVPPGAVAGADGGDSWNWIGSNPGPFSGTLAHQSAIAAGGHQHFFYWATNTMHVNSNDTLIAYVYLDPANPPSEVMLQWTASSWEHRAYWGANQITYGADGTTGRRYMGPLPPVGQWVRLSVAATNVALDGKDIDGMAFTLYGGRATWDHAGKGSSAPPPPPPDTNAPIVSISAPANNAVVSGSPVTISANASDNVAVASVQFRVDGANLGASDVSGPYSISWDTTATANGIHQLSAVAVDTSGNRATSAVVSVTVSNVVADTTPPSVALSAPANNSMVSGNTVSITATASDNVAVAGVQFRLDGANLGAADGTPPYSILWDSTVASNGLHQLTAIATDTSGNRATSSVIDVTVSNAVASNPDFVWVDDALPAGAVTGADGGDSWSWIGSNPLPFSGTVAHQSAIATGEHQHFFAFATSTMHLNSNDTLFAYVYLDPANPPQEVMLQWTASSWEHRAYWGANQIGFGADGTPTRRYMGPLPPLAQWIRLSVAATNVALEGKDVDGMAFTVYGGRATWDYAGKNGSPPPPPDTNAPIVTLTAPTNNSMVSGTAVSIAANASDDVALASVQFIVDGQNLGAMDTTAPYSVSWNTTTFNNGPHQLWATATDSSGNRGTSAVVTVTVSNSASDTIWVEDALPAGATAAADGGDSWNWIASNPAPFSGALASQSSIAAGLHQHYFYGATATFTVNTGDSLIAYVYLDPANVPAEIMLQWNENGSWEHRAFWGQNQILYGASGTISRRPMGALPPSGQWVRLTIPASQVGLEGRTLNGMAFSVFGGRATWDHAGKGP
jgi:beta-glucosidase